MTQHDHHMLEMEVEWLLPDGRTGGRTPEGLVVRLKGDAVPGERVRARRDSRSGRVVDATLEERLSESPARRAPSCAWASSCGGCDLASWEPEARHLALRQVVGRALRLPTLPELVSDHVQEGHRARIDLSVEGGRVGYRRSRSHALVEVSTCAIARPELQQALQETRRWIADHEEDTRAITGVSLRSDGQRVVRVFRAPGRLSAPLREALSSLPDTAFEGQSLSGNPTLELEVAGLPLLAGPSAFFQVHLDLNERLVEHVLELLSGYSPVLDLYSGIGNFSLPLAAQGARVTAVEAEGQALKNLRSSQRRHNLEVEAIAARVEKVDLTQHAFEAVLLDPPRAGARGVLPRVARQRPRRIVYVSCHPPALARDLGELSGYRLASVRCFDLFPQTHHIETVVALDRTSGNDSPVLPPLG